MFCTSTLLEGVNLPADNLFIMDNKIALSEMNPVDFRNLIGRVGRISFNLYGNVFFVSEKDSKVSSEDYVQMLQQDIPEEKDADTDMEAGELKVSESAHPYHADNQKDKAHERPSLLEKMARYKAQLSKGDNQMTEQKQEVLQERRSYGKE